MKILGLLKGKTPEQIEATGDNFFARGEYGSSRLEYEKALSKLEKSGSETALERGRLEKKMDRSCNALASDHERNAKELMKSGYHEDAESLLALALELATDGEIIASIQKGLELLKNQSPTIEREDVPPHLEYIEGQEPVSNELLYEEPGDHYFGLLVSTLPEEDQSAYHDTVNNSREDMSVSTRAILNRLRPCLQRHSKKPGPLKHSFPLNWARLF